MAVWALLSISQTGKAADVTVYFQCPSDWTTPVCAYAYNSDTDNNSSWGNAPAGTEYYTSTGVKLWKCTFDSKYKYVIFKDPKENGGSQYPGKNKKGLEVKDNYVYTFGGTSGTSLSEFENGGTTPSEFTKLYVWGNFKGEKWGVNDLSREFTTSDGKIYQYVFGTDITNGFSNNTADFYFRVKAESMQYAPPTNDDPVGTDYTSAKESSSGAWKFTMTKGKSYTLIFDYENKQIKYSEEGSGIVTPPTPSGENPIANRKYSEGYYLVGNFFNFDGADINYKDAVFKFEQQKDDAEGNAVYMVEIPATLTAKAQVMSVDATGTPNAVYGPTKGYATIDNTHPVVGEDHTAKLGPEILVESTKISENDGNFWNMRSRRTEKTEGGQDGSYTYYITIDKTTHKPSSWTIKYDDMKRVAYYLSTDEKATAMTLNSVRSDVNGEFNAGKYQGTLYAQEGSEFYAISNAMRHIDNNNNIFAEYRDQVVVMDNILSTYPKLFLWGNGGKPLGETGNFIAATNGTFKLSDGVVGISSWEFNSNNGNNDDNSKYGNTGGQVIKKSTNKTITSLSMVGTAIPGTTTGSEWNWASTVADMDYDISENCYKLTIATTDDCTNKPFRFVGNHTQEINWFENGLEETDKAATYPYAENPVGHKASPSDPNEVSYTENGLRESTDDNVNIIWNRPAGTYTVRFYIYTYSQNGNDPSYRYFYTITENHSVALKDFKNVSYNGNVRNILNRGSYRFFRTFSDTKAWKCPNGVHIYIVNKFIPAKEETSTSEVSTASYSLKEINSDSHIIPENTGVILATADETVGAYSEKTDPNYYNLLTINLTEVAKGTSYEKPAEGESLLTPLYVGRTLSPEDGDYYNYLFGFYRAQRFDPTVDPSTFWLGFWISNGTGIYNSNGAYMKISKEQAKGMRLGTSYSFGTDGKAKCIPALLFDFANANETTGINMVKNTTIDDKYYTLSGVQVTNPSTKGIYIHNGKKIVIK